MEVFGLFGRSFACGLGAIMGVALGVATVAGMVSVLRPPEPSPFRLGLAGLADDMERWRRISEPEPDPEPQP